MKPFESYKKYFKENFKFLEEKPKKIESSISKNTSNNKEDNNNIETLKRKLNFVIEGIKLGARNTINNNRSSIMFKMESNDSMEDENNANKDDKNEPGGKYQYLKILDIRKNEHFGNIFMFMEKPAPLTLIVKSKIAEIFYIRKKDAIMINNLHHNIVKRIHDKSYKNLLSIKKKTFKILKKYFDLSNYDQIYIQDNSWFNEKSKNTIINDITNFINNSILKSEKNEINGTTINMKNIKSFLKDTNIKTNLSQATINFIDNKNTENKSTNLLSSVWTPKVKKPGNFKNSVISNINPKYFPLLIMQKRSNANLNSNNLLNRKRQSVQIMNKNFMKEKECNKTNNSSSKLFNKNNNNMQLIPSNVNTIQTSTNKELFEQESLELTMEQEMLTLNNLNNDIDDKIRNKIRSSVKKNKILKINEIQNIMINSYQDEINNLFVNDNGVCQFLNKFKKINEVNKILYKNLIEYFETDCETDEEKVVKKPLNDKNKLISERTIDFNIQASYYNLNNLTKGKIIKKKNYKEDIKNLIEKFIKNRKKNSLNLINEFIKLYANKNFTEENIIKKKFTKNIENNSIPHIDNISLVFNNIINENTVKSKKKLSPKFPRHSRTKNINIPTSPKFNSNQIKKTKTNNKDVYKNFKNIDYDGKSSQFKLNNNNKKNNKLNYIGYNIGNSKQNEDKENNEDNSSNVFAKIINKFLTRLK